MIVGIQRLTFHIPANENSARALAQRIKARLWRKFKVAIAEVNESTSSELVLGIAHVGISKQTVNTKADSIVRDLNDWGTVELVGDEKDVLVYEDLEMERDFEKYNP